MLDAMIKIKNLRMQNDSEETATIEIPLQLLEQLVGLAHAQQSVANHQQTHQMQPRDLDPAEVNTQHCTFSSSASPSHSLLQQPSLSQQHASIETPMTLRQQVFSGDVALQCSATEKFRKMLSIERNPPIQDVIECGVVPYFVEFLKRADLPQLQFEAAWVLTNIASGARQQTATIIDVGAIPIFITLLESPADDVREQAVWALGNIAGDGPDNRDRVLQSGVLAPLLRLLNDNTAKVTMFRKATWSLSNLCRGKNPPPDFAVVSESLQTLAQLMYHTDDEVLTDACWALSYLTDGTNDKIQRVIEAGVCRRLVELLMHHSTNIITPALRSIGNIFTGDDVQTQVVLNCHVIPGLARLLTHQKETIKKEACWTISNIAAGSQEHIQAVIDGNLIPPIFRILAAQNGDVRTRQEAAWAISNLTSRGNKHHIEYLVQQGVIKLLSDLLEVTDTKLIKLVLDATYNLLKAYMQPDGRNLVADYFKECGGLEKIKECQSHDNESVHKKALELIEPYFGEEKATKTIFASASAPSSGK